MRRKAWLERRRQQAASIIGAAARRWWWRRWRRAALLAQQREAVEVAAVEATAGAASEPAVATATEPAEPVAVSAGPAEVPLWDAVFAAQSELTQRMGLSWPQQIERNLEAMRLRFRREQERKEAREIGMALARGWREQERELRRDGVRLPTGAGSGGRQRSKDRQRRQTARAEAMAGGHGYG